MEAQHELLGPYSQIGYDAEAVTLSDELLKKDPKDVAALRAKAKSLANRRQFEEALAACSKLNELAPNDLEGQILTLVLMSPQYLNLPAKDILARAEKNLADHPDDPRFVMLQGFAYHCTLDEKQARAKYVEAASKPVDDPEFVRFCTQLMDDVGQSDESLKLL